jgi:arylsulfatase A-like enzyme
MRWPRVVRPGSVCEVPVITDDFYPTILDIAHGKPSKNAVDGLSIVPC